MHEDSLKLTFLLLGKAVTSNIEHERLMYETATVHDIDNSGQ